MNHFLLQLSKFFNFWLLIIIVYLSAAFFGLILHGIFWALNMWMSIPPQDLGRFQALFLKYIFCSLFSLFSSGTPITCISILLWYPINPIVFPPLFILFLLWLDNFKWPVFEFADCFLWVYCWIYFIFHFIHCILQLHKLFCSFSWFLSLFAVLCLLGHVWLFATPCTVAWQAALSTGILQARILEWVVISSSRRSSHPRDWTQVWSCFVNTLFCWFELVFCSPIAYWVSLQQLYCQAISISNYG